MSQNEAPSRNTEPARSVGKHPIFTLGKQAISLLAICLCMLIGFRWVSDLRHAELLNEVGDTRADIEDLTWQLYQLRGEIDSLHLLDRTLRSLASLEPISDDVRRMGVGGALYEPRGPEFGPLSSEAIDQMLREASLLRQSFLESADRIGQRAVELEHTPTIRPVLDGFVSSQYGYRSDPFTGRRRMHKGIDFQAPRGTPVLAPASGRVIQAGRVAGFGRVIKLDHGNGIVTVYGHLSKIRVRNGQQVKRGELLGDVGSSGRSTSSHLHYEVRVNGRHMDPNTYIFDELADIR